MACFFTFNQWILSTSSSYKNSPLSFPFFKKYFILYFTSDSYAALTLNPLSANPTKFLAYRLCNLNSVLRVVLQKSYPKNFAKFTETRVLDRRVTRGWRGEVSPALFRRLEKIVLTFGKNALIMVIYGWSFSFKVQFIGVSEGKIRRFYPAGPFFFVL